VALQAAVCSLPAILYSARGVDNSNPFLAKESLPCGYRAE
jgi:hypothetical protein